MQILVEKEAHLPIDLPAELFISWCTIFKSNISDIFNTGIVRWSDARIIKTNGKNKPIPIMDREVITTYSDPVTKEVFFRCAVRTEDFWSSIVGKECIRIEIFYNKKTTFFIVTGLQDRETLYLNLGLDQQECLFDPVLIDPKYSATLPINDSMVQFIFVLVDVWLISTARPWMSQQFKLEYQSLNDPKIFPKWFPMHLFRKP